MSLDHRLDQRLDDELRKAFKREQPSTDFTMRLLERVALETAPRESFWKKLAMLLEPPKLRWVAIGVTASLLLAIGLMQYTRVKPVSVDEKVVAVAEEPGKHENVKDTAHSLTNPSTKGSVSSMAPPRIKHPASSSTQHRLAQVRQEERELRAEGEAAKETLMLALSIASSTLNDAQKAVHDDGLKP